MIDHKGYEVRAVYKPEVVLDEVGPGRKEWDGLMIKMNSQRYRLFQRSCKCVRCGVVGTRMYLEKAEKCNENSWHFNLYGVREDGTEVMMTKDHIIPKSLGGKNCLENYQTMCSDCNGEKGNIMEHRYMIAIARTKRLREDFMVEFTGSFKNLEEAWNAGLEHLWSEHPETMNMRRTAVLHAWQNFEGSHMYFSKDSQRRWWKPLFMGVSNGREDNKHLKSIEINDIVTPYIQKRME